MRPSVQTPKPVDQQSMIARLIGGIGRFVISRLLYLVDLAAFIGHALWHGRHLLQWGNQATRRSLVTQLIFSGVDALPIVTVLALAMGLTLTTQILALTNNLGSSDEVLHLLTSLIGMEFGSLLTAIILIGRSGSAIAVDLGNMKLHGEVEGLELLGIDLTRFFIAPRILGMAISQLVLAGYFYFIALFGGAFLWSLLVSNGDFGYLARLAHTFSLLESAVYVFKNLLFGLIIAGCACFHALKVERSPTEVPQATQRAIASSLLLVFVLDGAFALTLALR